MKRTFGKIALCILALAMLLGMVTALSQNADAFTSMTLVDGKLDLTTIGTPQWTYEDGKVSCNYTDGGTTTTLTFTNNLADGATLVFKYDLTLAAGREGPTTATINGKEYSVAVRGKATSWYETCQVSEMNYGDTVTITMATGADEYEYGGMEVRITIYDISLVAPKDITLTFQPADCDYTVLVNGVESKTVTATGAEQTVTGKNTDTYSIQHTNTEYTFLGVTYTYANGSTGTTYAENGVFKLTETGTITPVFLKQSGTAPFLVGSTNCYTWESAMATAKSSGSTVIIQIAEYTLPETLLGNGMTENGTYTYVDTATGKLTYKLPIGVTLLLPYNLADTYINLTDRTQQDYLVHANYKWERQQPSLDPYEENTVTCEFTIPQGVTLLIDETNASSTSYGRIVVGGQIGCNGGSSVNEGGTYQAHANLVVNGTLELGNYAVLATTGYILGRGTVVTTGANAEIYLPFLINDWRGAGIAATYIENSLNAVLGGPLTTGSTETQTHPYTQWGFTNIRCKLTITQGNYIHAYCTLSYDDKAYHSHPVMIGDEDRRGLLELTKDKNAAAHISYEAINWTTNTDSTDGSKLNPIPGRTTVVLTGGASLGSMSLAVNISGIGELNIQTSNLTMIIPYSFAVILENGDYTINNSLALLPGASMTVMEKATLTIGSSGSSRFMVFDGLTHRFSNATGSDVYGIGDKGTKYSKAGYTIAWSASYADKRANRKNYPTATELCDAGLGADADFIVNGKLVIGAKTSIGGIIQTDGTGIVDATNAGGLSTSVRTGVVGAQNILLTFRYAAAMSVSEQNARLYDISQNKMLDVIEKKIYYGLSASTTNAGYSFTYYSGSKWTKNAFLVGPQHTVNDGAKYTVTFDTPEPIRGGWTIDPCVAGRHTDANTDGLCDSCGTLVFYAVNVNLGNNLDMLFAFSKTAADNKGASYVTFTHNGNSTSLNIADWQKTNIAGGESVTGQTYYVVSYSFAAKEMCDYVTVTVHDAKGNVISESKTDSIRDYAHRIMEYNKLESRQTLIVDMLNYGAACQAQFDYNTANPANALLMYAQQVVNASAIEWTDEANLPAGSNSNLTNLVTLSNIRFAVNGVNADMQYTFSNHWGRSITGNYLYDKDEKYYYIDTLVVSDAQRVITLSDGVTDSIEAYCKRMIDQGKDANRVFTAFMKFSQSARIYLHRNDTVTEG